MYSRCVLLRHYSRFYEVIFARPLSGTSDPGQPVVFVRVGTIPSAHGFRHVSRGGYGTLAGRAQPRAPRPGPRGPGRSAVMTGRRRRRLTISTPSASAAARIMSASGTAPAVSRGATAGPAGADPAVGRRSSPPDVSDRNHRTRYTRSGVLLEPHQVRRSRPRRAAPFGAVPVRVQVAHVAARQQLARAPTTSRIKNRLSPPQNRACAAPFSAAAAPLEPRPFACGQPVLDRGEPPVSHRADAAHLRAAGGCLFRAGPGVRWRGRLPRVGWPGSAGSRGSASRLSASFRDRCRGRPSAGAPFRPGR